MTPITAASLAAHGAINHGFFTRQGGVSSGIFASLNCGFGSGDAAERVRENRTRVANSLGLPFERLVTARQFHSADVVELTQPWQPQQPPAADAIVTRQRGYAIAILTADCAPVLLADPTSGVIGAAHAGWKGAIGGVVEATIARMESLGAKKSEITLAIGPCIGTASYEVGRAFAEPFIAANPNHSRFFLPARNSENHASHFQFDLVGYLMARLSPIGLASVTATGHDTCADSDQFFSYRRSCQLNEPNYGRLISTICLKN